MRSDPPIVFFDGVCGLCNQSVNFLIAIDRHKRLRYSPLQGETASRLLIASDRYDLKSIVLLDERGASRRTTALVRTLIHIGGIWGWVGRLLWLVPLPLRNLGYHLVVRNRYRIWGQLDACRLPRPGEQDLFLP